MNQKKRIHVLGVVANKAIPAQKHSGGDRGGRYAKGHFAPVFDVLKTLPVGQSVHFSHDYKAAPVLHSVLWTAAVYHGYKRGSLKIRVRGNCCYVGRAK
jgi:hypothetical protein